MLIVLAGQMPLLRAAGKEGVLGESKLASLLVEAERSH